MHEVPSVGDESWRDDAACLSVGDTDAWFPESGSTAAAAAKRVCAGCPVRVECLNFAVETDQQFGIWGGLSEHARRPLVVERRRARREAAASGRAAA